MNDSFLAGRALLDGVRQLMRDQFFAFGSLRLEFILAEKYIVAVGEGVRLQLRALMGCIRPGVNPNVIEICTEARLHEVTHRGWQRRAGSTAHARCGFALGSGRFALHLRFRDLPWRGPRRRSRSRMRHACDMPRNRFGFHLRRVRRFGNASRDRSGLNRRREDALHGTVADAILERASRRWRSNRGSTPLHHISDNGPPLNRRLPYGRQVHDCGNSPSARIRAKARPYSLWFGLFNGRCLLRLRRRRTQADFGR